MQDHRARLRARRRFPRGTITVLAVLAAGMGSAHAQTWNGAGFSDNWSNLLNWQGLQRPVSGATTAITFAGGARLTPVQDLGSPFTLNSLTFAINAGAFSLRGNGLRFDGSDGRLLQNSGSSVAILNEVQLATNLAIDGPGTITLGGNLSRASGLNRDTLVLTKRGTGTLVLAGANSYDATLRIGAGQVLLRNVQALQNANVVLNIDNGLSFGTLAQATLAGLSGTGALGLGTTALTIGGVDDVGLYSGGITGTTGTIAKTGSGTARWSGNSQFDRLQITAGRMQLEGGALTLTNGNEGLMVGNNSAVGSNGPVLEMSNGAGASATGRTVQVDGAAGTLLRITGAGTQLDTGFQTLFGNHAIGTLEVAAGGALAAGTFLAFGFNDASNGTLHVNAGGTVTGNIGLLGTLTGATGTADVAGSNARWIINSLGIGGVNESLRGGSGTVTVRDGGQVQVFGDLTLWTASSSVTVNGGSLSVGALVSDGAVSRITLLADPTDGRAMTLGRNGGSASYNGDIDGEGGLSKIGTSTQVLGGRNSFTGMVQVQGGTLQMANSAASEYEVTGGTLRLGERNLGFAVVQAGAGGQVVYTNTTLSGGLLAGAGNHDISAVRRLVGTRLGGGSVLTPASGTTFVGVVSEGTVDVLAGRSLTWNSGSNPNGTLNVAGTANVSNFSSGGQIQIDAGGTLISTGGNLVLGGGSRTTVGDADLPGGTIELLAGGRLQLNGGLLVNNGRIAGPVEVNFGSLAKGAGEYGAVTVNDGGRFSPGNSPGNVTTGDATWGSGGTLVVELAAADGTAGEQWDLWTIDGVLSIESGITANSRFTISLATLDGRDQAAALAGFDPHRAWQWQIVDTTGGIVGFDPARVALDTQGFMSPLAGGTLHLALQDGDLYVQFAPVPEPEIWAQLLAGLGGIAWFLRRRRREGRTAA